MYPMYYAINFPCHLLYTYFPSIRYNLLSPFIRLPFHVVIRAFD